MDRIPHSWAMPWVTPSLAVLGVGAEANLGSCVPSALVILGSWTGNETSVTQKTFANNINIAFMIAQNIALGGSDILWQVELLHPEHSCELTSLPQPRYQHSAAWVNNPFIMSVHG